MKLFNDVSKPSYVNGLFTFHICVLNNERYLSADVKMLIFKSQSIVKTMKIPQFHY